MHKRFLYQFLFILGILVVLAAVGLGVWWFVNANAAVLTPAGLIGQQERDLFMLILKLSLIVIVPVFVLTIFVVYRYRESNSKAKHNPDWDYKPIVDAIWWTIPTLLIIVFSVIIWKSTYALDPYKPISAVQADTTEGGTSGMQVAPITIQVVAMDWKWLFIYPEQGIASVNMLEIPQNTPINFEITSDAPMNSFWIPQLGGQIYAMPSMSTELHLIASTTGTYEGVSANLSGAGFAGMNFPVVSVSSDDFNAWASSIRQSSNALTSDIYDGLAQPSTDNPATYYSLAEPELYNEVMMKDMMGAGSLASTSSSMPGMNM